MNNENKPYLVDAVAGNGKLLVSLGQTGRMYRLWWPHINFPQHLDTLRTGLAIAGEEGQVTWFDEPGATWTHQAHYAEGTAIFKVLAQSEQYGMVIATDTFAVPDTDVLVRRYQFRNTGMTTRKATFIHYSALQITENPLYNTTCFDVERDALTHFRHNYYFSLGSSNVCTGYHAGSNAWATAQNNQLAGTDIDMQPDGILSWELQLAPGAMTEVTVYLAAGFSATEAGEQLRLARAETAAHWEAVTAAYWEQFLAQSKPCPLDRADARILYDRSLITMKLMSDEQTGAVIAAPEFDETFSRCGGYAYCWGRDAAFITTAMDQAGLTALTSRFYDWALSAQDADGAWQQRHYHDGRLAPSWGMQIDEGASLIWGMWQHYAHTQNADFAAAMWPAVKAGANYLLTRLDDETGLPLPSIDLWEERMAEHVYSAAAVFGGFQGASSFAQLHGETALAAEWEAAAHRIREGVIARCWNETKQSYFRGLKLSVSKEKFEAAVAGGAQGKISSRAKGYPYYELAYDDIVDVSLIGLSVPFGLLPVEDERMEKTADTIERLLTSPAVHGIKRYEDDHYAGGNPWILTTLWLCHYRIAQNRLAEAERLLDWALAHQTPYNLLPEQIDKTTGEAAWVVPLTWSHAMYVLAVHMLAERRESLHLSDSAALQA